MVRAAFLGCEFREHGVVGSLLISRKVMSDMLVHWIMDAQLCMYVKQRWST